MNTQNELRRRNQMDLLWDFCCFVTVLCSLGFPGNYERFFPGVIRTLFQYGPFLLQIVLMLLSSGDSFLDIKLIDFKKIYLPVYVMLAVWFAVSMMSTRFPREELIACVRFSVTAIFALWMVDKYDIYHMIEICYFACLAMMLFTLIALVIMPGTSFSYEAGVKTFCGLYTTKNPCASELSIGLIINTLMLSACMEKTHPLPRFYAASWVLHICFLILCKATGAIFSALIPIFYLIYMQRTGGNKLRLQLGILYIGASVGFLFSALTILPIFAPLLEAIGKDATLTNRTPMWQQLINVMTYNNTMTGFGFAMFWKDPQAVALFHSGFSKGSWGNTMTFGAHNTLLEIWLDVGLLGLTAYFGMLIMAFRHPGRIGRIEYEFCSGYIIWQMIKGLTERSYIPFNYQTLFLFLCVGIGLSAQSPQIKQKIRRYGQQDPPTAPRIAKE